MTDPERHDWQALIARLERHMKHIEIGAYCGRSEGWVGLLKRGAIKEPPHPQGEMLLKLDVRFSSDASQETQYPQVGSQV